MRIGIDFDNTIVCYDHVFFPAAREKNLIPATVAPTKAGVRDFLRQADREDEWTALQGFIYGARMDLATPFPGAIEFIAEALKSGNDVFIVSHKTRKPYLGPAYDLHSAARDWLENRGIVVPGKVGLPAENVYFELTKDEKLERIGALRCTHYIDDLPELLDEPGFPKGVERLLFEPGGIERPMATEATRMRSWNDIRRYFVKAGALGRV